MLQVSAKINTYVNFYYNLYFYLFVSKGNLMILKIYFRLFDKYYGIYFKYSFYIKLHILKYAQKINLFNN